MRSMEEEELFDIFPLPFVLASSDRICSSRIHESGRTLFLLDINCINLNTPLGAHGYKRTEYLVLKLGFSKRNGFLVSDLKFEISIELQRPEEERTSDRPERYNFLLLKYI